MFFNSRLKLKFSGEAKYELQKFLTDDAVTIPENSILHLLNRMFWNLVFQVKVSFFGCNNSVRFYPKSFPCLRVPVVSCMTHFTRNHETTRTYCYLYSF